MRGDQGNFPWARCRCLQLDGQLNQVAGLVGGGLGSWGEALPCPEVASEVWHVQTNVMEAAQCRAQTSDLGSRAFARH